MARRKSMAQIVASHDRQILADRRKLIDEIRKVVPTVDEAKLAVFAEQGNTRLRELLEAARQVASVC